MKLFKTLLALVFTFTALGQYTPNYAKYDWQFPQTFSDTIFTDNDGNSTQWNKAYDFNFENLSIEYADTPLFEVNRGLGGSWYVPAAIKVGDSIYIFGKNFPNIYVKSSIDGINYTDNELGQIAVTPDGDKIEYSIPLLNSTADTISLFYIDQDSLKRAFNIPANLSTTQFTKVSGGLLGISTINSDLSKSYTSIELGDIFVFGSKRYYLFAGYNASTTDIFRYEADTSTPYTLSGGAILLSNTDFPDGTTRFQTPSVVAIKDKYILALTAGGTDSVYDQKSIYMGISDSPIDWNVPFGRTITPNFGESTGLRTYTGYFMKAQDNAWLEPEIINGKIRYYYSGHSLNFNINEGFVHLAQIDTSFSNNNYYVTKNELDQSLDNYPFILSRKSAQWPAMVRYKSGNTVRWYTGLPNGDDEFFDNNFYISNSSLDTETPALSINSNYQIGLNRNDQAFPLDILTSSNTYVNVETTSGSGFVGLRFEKPTGVWTFRLDEDDNISLRGGTVTNQKFIVTPNGDVAIGNNVSSATSKLDVSGDIETGSANWIYFGDPTTNGSWRMGRDGNNFVHQRRESGVWVTKQTITP